MLEAERVRIISKLVQERSVVSVLDLVEILGASEATVRRDINGMAEAGVLRRIRGGVEALTPRHESHLVGTPFQLSQEIGVAQKRAIAQAAVGFIADGSSIIINGGTTTFAMVEFLVDRQIDILTNSVPILRALLTTSRNRVSVPGGTVYREQSIVLSPYENDSIEHFWGQQLFTGCFGLNRFGLMEADPLIVQAETKLLKRAEQLVVLADSRKLRQRSSMIVVGIERISTLITDQGATEDELEPFRRANIRVLQVAAPEEGDPTTRDGVEQR